MKWAGLLSGGYVLLHFPYTPVYTSDTSWNFNFQFLSSIYTNTETLKYINFLAYEE